MPATRLAFGPFAVDGGAQVALRDGEPLPVGQRGVQLLAALLSRPGEVLTKSELIDAAWGDAAIEESNLSVQVANLRKALGQTPAGGDWIVTIPRVGYRFVGPAADPAAGDASPRAERPSIAVLPFANLSSDPEQSYFADGLAEEIITALSKLTGLVVIARSSSFAYRGTSIDLRKAAEELGVDHLLTGSVRRSGSRVRMAVQLVAAARAEQLWAESYDRELTDIFAVQDEVTRRVIGALRPALAPGDAPPAAAVRPLDALDLFLEGRAVISAPNQTAETNNQGMALLEAALARDPTYVDAYVSLVIALITAYSNRWTDDPPPVLRAARSAAENAVTNGPGVAEARAARALVAMMEKDHELLRTETELAIGINPQSAFSNILRGGYLVNDGRPLLAIPHYEQAIRIDPGMTHLYIHHLGTAYLFAERYETAAALFRSRILLSPNTDMSRAYLCVALGHLGLAEEAQQVWAELMAIRPDYSLSERLGWWYYRDPADPIRLIDGLRKAGLPT